MLKTKAQHYENAPVIHLRQQKLASANHRRKPAGIPVAGPPLSGNIPAVCVVVPVKFSTHIAECGHLHCAAVLHTTAVALAMGEKGHGGVVFREG